MKTDKNKCDGCFYSKPRDADPETNEIAWGPWCMESGQPVPCKDASPECDKDWIDDQDQADGDNYEQLALKYATSNKRKR